MVAQGQFRILKVPLGFIKILQWVSSSHNQTLRQQQPLSAPLPFYFSPSPNPLLQPSPSSPLFSTPTISFHCSCSSIYSTHFFLLNLLPLFPVFFPLFSSSIIFFFPYLFLLPFHPYLLHSFFFLPNVLLLFLHLFIVFGVSSFSSPHFFLLNLLTSHFLSLHFAFSVIHLVLFFEYLTLLYCSLLSSPSFSVFPSPFPLYSNPQIVFCLIFSTFSTSFSTSSSLPSSPSPPVAVILECSGCQWSVRTGPTAT